MRKMRTPEIDVIRFTESDVIVASAKTITVAGLGDPYNVSATFKMGANTWDSNTIVLCSLHIMTMVVCRIMDHPSQPSLKLKLEVPLRNSL